MDGLLDVQREVKTNAFRGKPVSTKGVVAVLTKSSRGEQRYENY